MPASLVIRIKICEAQNIICFRSFNNRGIYASSIMQYQIHWAWGRVNYITQSKSSVSKNVMHDTHLREPFKKPNPLYLNIKCQENTRCFLNCKMEEVLLIRNGISASRKIQLPKIIRVSRSVLQVKTFRTKAQITEYKVTFKNFHRLKIMKN